MWTTPSADRDECDGFKNDFNAVYAPLIEGIAGGHGPMVSNRMARFTHQEGFPDPEALFEVQIKAVQGDSVSIDSGTIDYGYWQDHQPSGASTMHTNAAGETITKVPGGAGAEFDFIMGNFEEKFAAAGADLKTQCVWCEILVAVDEAGDDDARWAAVEEGKRTSAPTLSAASVADRQGYALRQPALRSCLTSTRRTALLASSTPSRAFPTSTVSSRSPRASSAVSPPALPCPPLHCREGPCES